MRCLLSTSFTLLYFALLYCRQQVKPKPSSSSSSSQHTSRRGGAQVVVKAVVVNNDMIGAFLNSIQSVGDRPKKNESEHNRMGIYKQNKASQIQENKNIKCAPPPPPPPCKCRAIGALTRAVSHLQHRETGFAFG